ncbi:RNB domain-containing ribonuclease [Leifsonia sp. F6_8S_P_1B]|uniref:RNB domain-containing ribonuclease n=1 Tax=Leifsonia williamsii TaxID=3035919 RepID=A0ABT8KCK5_9MICO|nr:RNB domain-containing ribonuclease [Leifsonia williamsii]MDN4615203.1 RNB domain-containing ribonuclease [Leifsonia williamsii]
MPDRRTRITASAAQGELSASLAALRHELGLPEGFPEEAEAEAARAAQAQTTPGSPAVPAADLTEVAFLTIDPAGSTDLDQALHLERDGDGFRLRYAIADVPALVAPGGAVDAEARRRGETYYAPDGRVPLHPAAIGEDAGSLLPGVVRSAFVWDVRLAADGAETSVTVARARIRSQRQWSYAEAQASLDDGSAPEPLALLAEVGPLRIEQERARGGASLNAPDEEIVLRDGAYTLERRVPLPVEDWNAQLSLLTGMAAARLMLDARVGILRTMPAPSAEAFASFRTQTQALGLPWPEDVGYGEYLRTLDHADPRAGAVLQAATGLFRGAGYVVMDGEPPADPLQSAIAAPYAHTTAPLRRLVDRWVLVVCEALCAGRPVPDWARASLGQLPSIMGASGRLASRLDAEAIARVEAALLAAHVGAEFDATVLGVRNGSILIQLQEPAVVASAPRTDGVRPGERVRVRLTAADIATGKVEFEPVPAVSAPRP